MELVVLHVVPHPPFEFLKRDRGLGAWTEAAVSAAQRFVDQIAAALKGPHYAATGRVLTGDATDQVAHEVNRSDLLVVSTHGYAGAHRFLFGSVSLSLVHRVAGSVLLVR